MSALLNSLPGDIPGLLRRGSLVVIGGETQAVRGLEYASDETLYLRLFGWGRPFHGAEVALDLTDPTGRAHAAWWVGARLDLTVWPIEPGSEDEARMLAQGGEDMTAEQIDLLARLVLRLAGRVS